ncbi:hypothetical protein INT47_008384 [Mucor saturninus]|uniref:Protein MEMO1 n=1 Tax=Mucor saturninus TaxID=64648 RepID=A0A8H7V703_9FUNG|nr:hypothetical protein INT47_008384 [Mucor saturninus]
MIRSASHAGTWYIANKTELNEQLETFFERATKEHTSQKKNFPIQGVRAIIGPHAGFQYSGPTAAFAYKAVDISKIKRVFLLGPSHQAYFDGCNLSKCDTYETPLGNLQVDRQVTEALYQTEKFGYMTKTMDEREHSLEMHLPFIYKLFERKINEIKIVPILVGSISDRKERMYGETLADYLSNPENLFIISSDFCHWGSRFRYTYYTGKENDKDPILLSERTEQEISRPIHESIKELDSLGIEQLKSLSFEKFHTYLEQTGNTICGRHPIGVLMAALEILKNNRKTSNQTLVCIKYDQSSACKRIEDSSVSYASIYVQIE